MAAYKETLRSLALNDEGFLESVLGMGHDTVEVSRLDKKTHALVRLGAAFAIDAAPSSYQSNIDLALAAGAQVDEIVGTLIAVAPTVGTARVVSAAPELALALGYDLEAAFEGTEGRAMSSPARARARHRVGRRRLRRLVEHAGPEGVRDARSMVDGVPPSRIQGVPSNARGGSGVPLGDETAGVLRSRATGIL